MKDSYLKNNLSNLETFILIMIFAVVGLIYAGFGVFQSDINPLIKIGPFFALLVYAYLKGKWNVKKEKETAAEQPPQPPELSTY